MRHYRVTLISAASRIERSVIAASTIAAIRIGISMMGELQGPVGITCKLSDNSPCAA